VELVQPFERSLQDKQQRMNAALDAFGALVDYEVGEVTAAATFYMAEVYSDFSRALSTSERPTDLTPEEMQEYASALEENAFPFEEKAIAIHEKNLELLASGVFNAWIDKSLGRLAELMPGRYAKSEASSGWIGSLETYAYRAPSRPGAATDPLQTAGSAAPASAPAAVVEPVAGVVEPVADADPAAGVVEPVEPVEDGAEFPADAAPEGW
jgi:hypothetical protein